MASGIAVAANHRCGSRAPVLSLCSGLEAAELQQSRTTVRSFNLLTGDSICWGKIVRGKLKKVKNCCSGVWRREVLLEQEWGLLRPQREQESEQRTDLAC